MSFFRIGFYRVFLIVFTVALSLPILNIMAAWGLWDSDSTLVLQHMAQTVLPEYVVTSFILCIGVALGVTLLGGSCAVVVTLFEFPFKRTLQWMLILPLAMPAYVVAYAYTDFFDYSGAAQIWLRRVLELEGRVLPSIRSLGGAILIMSVTLYPYVYLLTRTALNRHAKQLTEAAALLGASTQRIFWQIALPLCRPALAAGVALALMETLADYGVSSYFGIQTFTVGIYKSWLVMNNATAATGLASMLLLLVGVLLWMEQRAQSTSHSVNTSSSQAPTLHGYQNVLAWLICLLPITLGFLLPMGILVHSLLEYSLWPSGDDVVDSSSHIFSAWTQLPWAQLGHWTFNSLWLGAVSACLAVMTALIITAWTRLTQDPLASISQRLLGLGYAVPGAVVVIGLLLPLGGLQQLWPHSQIAYVITATCAGLIWAYLVRFVCVALQSIQSGYAQIPVSLDESARVLGRSSFDIWRHIHWPLLGRPIAAASLLVAVDVMKELPVTLVLRPFDTDTLAVVAYQLARDERLGEAALPCMVLVLVGLLPVLLIQRHISNSHSHHKQ